MLAIHLSLVEVILFHQLCFRHFQCKLLYRKGLAKPVNVSFWEEIIATLSVIVLQALTVREVVRG